MERRVVVVGAPSDLDRAVRELSGDVRITLEDGAYCLVAPEITQALDAGSARVAAERLLPLVTGLLRLDGDLAGGLEAGSVVEIGSDGSRRVHGFVFAQAATAVVAVGVPTVTGGAPAPPLARPFDVGLAMRAQPDVDLVARLLATGDTWANLYKIIDVIRSAAGGTRILVDRGWIDATTLERISLTANAKEKALEGGRHARPDYALARARLPEIGLEEAAAAVKGLVRGWLLSLP